MDMFVNKNKGDGFFASFAVLLYFDRTKQHQEITRNF